MSQTISFPNYTPPARFDDLPWTDVRIEESDTSAFPSDTTTWTQIDSQALSPLDTDPASPILRDITTSLASDTPDLWYRLIWVDAALTTSAPTVPIQNGTTTPYASVEELFRVLKVRDPSAEQIDAAQGDLETATLEIDTEIDLSEGVQLNAKQLRLVKGVCIDRAADLWRHRESAPGILGIVDEGSPAPPGRYSWARYAARLSNIKDQWAVA